MREGPAAIELATVHALAWLVVACGIGLLLSVLLLVPELGVVLGPLSYGRWMPLHLNLVLYGWLSLPLVALLFRAYLPEDGTGGETAVRVWSASLGVGAVAWLAGQSSGKPFLDWEGVARAIFLANLLFLAGVLAAGLVRRRRGGEPWRPGLWTLWVLLLGVPVSLAFATSPGTYPPINPATGGPTGASLLGSTLAVIAIFVGTPWLLGLSPARPHPPTPSPIAPPSTGRGGATSQRPEQARVGGSPSPGWRGGDGRGGQGVRSKAPPPTGTSARSWRGDSLLVFGALGVHAVFFAAVSHGEPTHREPLQIAAVATLLVWAWLVPLWLRRFSWPAGSRPWLFAFLAWGGLLLASSVPMFLPGLLDRIKFTNALVGHAHLAMAGMTTSFAALLLVVLNQETRLATVLGDRAAFLLWHTGNGFQVASLAAAGALEAADPGIVFRGDWPITALYGVRAAAGAAMLAAAVRWIVQAARGAA